MELARDLLRDYDDDKEHFWAILLNAQNRGFFGETVRRPRVTIECMSVSKDYWRALQVSLVFQIFFALFMIAPAMGIELLIQWILFALATYWGGFIVMLVRRPKTPTKLDLFLVRWGFLPLLFLFVPTISILIWRLKGSWPP